MSTSFYGKRPERREPSTWLPSQGKYLSRLKLTMLRDYLYALFAASPAIPTSQERATEVLQRLWREKKLREPGNSHAYRHLLTLRLLGLVTPHGRRAGYALTPFGLHLLDIGVPNNALSDEERNLLIGAVFNPPPDMASPLLAFAHLFAPAVSSPQEFYALGQPIILQRPTSTKLEVLTVRGSETIRGEEAIDHIVSGCRELFLEVGLIGESPLEAASRQWQRRLFPVRKVTLGQVDAATDQAVAYIREKLRCSNRLPIPMLSNELRPMMKLTHDDYQDLLVRISKKYAGEFYFDRLSSILIAGREDAYVRIGDYWRSSIIRY